MTRYLNDLTPRERWLREAPLHKVAAYLVGDTPEEREEIESYLEMELERRDMDREARLAERSEILLREEREETT